MPLGPHFPQEAFLNFPNLQVRSDVQVCILHLSSLEDRRYIHLVGPAGHCGASRAQPQLRSEQGCWTELISFTEQSQCSLEQLGPMTCPCSHLLHVEILEVPELLRAKRALPPLIRPPIPLCPLGPTSPSRAHVGRRHKLRVDHCCDRLRHGGGVGGERDSGGCIWTFT